MRWTRLFCAALTAALLSTASACGGGGGGGGGGGSPPGPPSPPPPPPPASGISVTVSPGQVFQTIEGWEVSPRFWQEDKVNNRYNPEWLTYRDEMISRAVNELGINRVRVELVSGSENPTDYYARWYSGQLSYTDLRLARYERINDNADPQARNAAGFHFTDLDYQIDNVVLPMRQRLQARGETLQIILCYIDFDGQSRASNVSHATNAAEYAELIEAAFLHMQGRGVTPEALEIVLEPENTSGWRGTQIGQALVAAQTRLSARGFNIRYIAPSTTLASNAVTYFNGALNVSGAGAVVDLFSYHTYDNPADQVRQQIWQRASQAGVRTGMTEHLSGDIDELYRDLTIANVSVWQQYGIGNVYVPNVSDEGYLIRFDSAASGAARFKLASRTPALAQVFRHVRANARRIGVSAAASSLRPLAFINANNGYVVAVISSSANDIAVSGLPAGTYGVQYSTESAYAANAADVTVASGGVATARIPAEGVITFYRK